MPFGVRPGEWLYWLAGIAILLGLAVRPAEAQQVAAISNLAGVTFPVAGRIWFPDPERTQAAALNDLANRLDRSCAGMEFQVWDVATDAAAEQLRGDTDVAFGQAGWTLELVPAADGARSYLATRGAEQLILVWLRPLADQIGLALCIVEVAAAPLDEGAGGAIRIAEVTAEDGTPLPRPRPDPNAIPADTPTSILVGAIPTEPVLPAPTTANETLPLPEPVVAQAPEPAPVATPSPPSPVVAEAAANSGGGPSIGLLLLSAALGFGAFFLVRWGLGTMRDRSVSRGPTTIATVVYSQVASEDRRDRSGRDLVRYLPVIAYEYAVEGAVYQAARLRFGDTAEPELLRARRVAERFPIGAGIEIHYNPSRPGEATIETDPDRIDIGLVAGIALGVLALASLINAVV